MTTVYIIVKYLTFVGAYMKGFFEQLSCRVYEVLIEDGRYLTATELCGHVEHEIIKKRSVSFGVCFFPFLFNLILGLVFVSVGSMNVYFLGEFFNYNKGIVHILNFVFLWLGISMLTNLFPQIEDALTLRELIYGKNTNIVLKILAAPIFAVLYCGAFLERWGITFLTSIAFSLAVPSIYATFLPSLIGAMQ